MDELLHPPPTTSRKSPESSFVIHSLANLCPQVPLWYTVDGCQPPRLWSPQAVKSPGWKKRTGYLALWELSEALAPLWIALSPSFHSIVCLILLISHPRSLVRVIPNW